MNIILVTTFFLDGILQHKPRYRYAPAKSYG